MPKPKSSKQLLEELQVAFEMFTTCMKPIQQFFNAGSEENDSVYRNLKDKKWQMDFQRQLSEAGKTIQQMTGCLRGSRRTHDPNTLQRDFIEPFAELCGSVFKNTSHFMSNFDGLPKVIEEVCTIFLKVIENAFKSLKTMFGFEPKTETDFKRDNEDRHTRMSLPRPT